MKKEIFTTHINDTNFDSNNNSIVDSLKKNIPCIYMELNLIFDNDTNMNQITSEIGLNPTTCRDKKDQRKSPFKDDKLEAFWSIETGMVNSYYLEDVTIKIINIIKPYLKKIKEIVDKYNGTVSFMIVPEFHPLYTPALCFNREFLEIVEYFNATIHIDMYIDD